MRRLAFTVAYDGTSWCGSQRQRNGRTIQGELERVTEGLFHAPTPVTLAGRTDAGVHARGQVAAFETPNQSLPVERLDLAMNARLDRSIRVREGREVEAEWHPRFSATGRVYVYRLQIGDANPLLRTVATSWTNQLDLTAARAASEAFLGRHDFAAWQSAGSPTPTTVRHVRRIEWRETAAFGSRLVEIEIEADAFLYQMVRNIVGALTEAGRGRLNAEAIRALTLGRDRTKCPAPAPPQGLCLERVIYGEREVQETRETGDEEDRDERRA